MGRVRNLNRVDTNRQFNRFRIFDRRSNLESNRNTQILKDKQSLIHVKHKETRDEQLCELRVFYFDDK